ncbi:hypothetical protein EG68_02054 [Paragonimus skrjabini miyazakii]|uniref:Uncharacterized protein n=1 Tax=Paragonimus skrjabini miyazakii TaxID=59628 RepID=A0A8S9Z0P9_9TREM|nr:hypothetical protein EG68_02054 [Paragonimus skrjabini miyazakii]
MCGEQNYGTTLSRIFPHISEAICHTASTRRRIYSKLPRHAVKLRSKPPRPPRHGLMRWKRTNTPNWLDRRWHSMQAWVRDQSLCDKFVNLSHVRHTRVLVGGLKCSCVDVSNSASES